MKLPKPAHKFGYTLSQVEEICRDRLISMDDFWNAFGVNTCTKDEKLGVIYYPNDIERVLWKLKAPCGKAHLWD